MKRSDLPPALRAQIDALDRETAERIAAAVAPEAKPGPDLSTLVCLADVVPEDVDFLHAGPLGDGWFPRGKHVQVEGAPDVGKTTLMIEVAARGSNAEPPWSTLILTAEDGLADTIRPRAGAAGADLSRIHVLDAAVSLPSDADMELLEAALAKTGAAMLVIDPLVSYLEVRDGHSNAIVRRALAPLVALCRRRGVCLVAISHLRKSLTGDAKTAGNGSGAFVANARSQIVVMPDPDDPDLRIVASGKMNLTIKPASQSYRLESVGKVARVSWQGVSSRTADVLCTPREAGEDRDDRTAAEDWLGRMLDEGTNGARDLQREAREAGMGWRSIERAKDSMGIVARRSGFGAGGKWVWVRMGSMAANGGQRTASGPHSPPKTVNPAIRTELDPAVDL